MATIISLILCVAMVFPKKFSLTGTLPAFIQVVFHPNSALSHFNFQTILARINGGLLRFGTCSAPKSSNNEFYLVLILTGQTWM